MRLEINNNTYRIYFVESDDENLLLEDTYHSGITNFQTKSIYIDKYLNEDSMKYTIIHELTHAYLDSYGFLQVDLNDEIVADIFGNYLPNIYEDYQNVMKFFYSEG